MRRTAALLYGTLCYLIFFGTFVYAIGFVANIGVPKSIDSGASGGVWPALIINLGLLALFGLQHSVMARPAFKRWWTRLVPDHVERSTYVLASSLTLVVLFWQWRPMTGTVWNITTEPYHMLLWVGCGLGWALVLVSTFMISHAHLFGVRQVADYFGRKPPSQPGFQTPGLYRQMRHPIMTGFLIAFWATPYMTAGHLLFAVVTTGYILVALQFEERDLIAAFGERYQRYREQVPMFLPRLMPGVKADSKNEIGNQAQQTESGERS